MSTDWTKYLDKQVEFTQPDFDDDRQVGVVKRVINDVLIVEVDGKEIKIYANQITGTGFE